MTIEKNNSPLSGLVVLDLTHMLSGPYGTMTLSDLGARTIKVEPPGKGEGTRQLLADTPAYSRDGMGAYFLTLNRGKESVALDLKSEEGLQVFYDLVRHADIVFDNFSAGVTKRLRIDHETLASINPRIITCTVTGFGETGPDTQRPAFDQVVQAMGGGMSITGDGAGLPTRSGIPIGDLGGGIFGAMGVLAAVISRERTGEGQHVDVSMLDVQISLLNYMATMYLMSGDVPDRIGNSHFVHVPYNVYPTVDGHVVVAEYEKQPARLRDKEKIDAAIGAAFQCESTAHWLEKLRSHRIPCGPVNNFAQALADPQVVARDMVKKVRLVGGDEIPTTGVPMKFSSTNAQYFTAPPRVGEDSQAVLRDLLGYSDTKIGELAGSGALGMLS